MNLANGRRQERGRGSQILHLPTFLLDTDPVRAQTVGGRGGDERKKKEVPQLRREQGAR